MGIIIFNKHFLFNMQNLGEVQMGGFTNGGLQMGTTSNLGLQMGNTSNLGLQMGNTSNLGLQMGSTSNLFDWKKAAGKAEKYATIGAKTYCAVHGCVLNNLGEVSMGGFTNLGEVSMGGFTNLGSVSMGGFSDLGLQMGSTSNLGLWKKAAKSAEKYATIGAGTYCAVHG